MELRLLSPTRISRADQHSVLCVHITLCSNSVFSGVNMRHENLSATVVSTKFSHRALLFCSSVRLKREREKKRAMLQAKCESCDCTVFVCLNMLLSTFICVQRCAQCADSVSCGCVLKNVCVCSSRFILRPIANQSNFAIRKRKFLSNFCSSCDKFANFIIQFNVIFFVDCCKLSFSHPRAHFHSN